MQRLWIVCSFIAFIFLPALFSNTQPALQQTAASTARIRAHAQRLSPLDLEIGGDILGEQPGVILYVSRTDLIALPQVTYRVVDDSNFTGPKEITGVLLQELARDLGASPDSDLVVAICDDKYRANYTRAYRAAHHPLLVLTVDGQDPAGWPKDSESHEGYMGPYMISHPFFTPSFRIFSHADEAQIPWGVVRIEFHNEATVLGAIKPRGAREESPLIEDGYRIAQQNCFRCHNSGREGGEKAGRPWPLLAAFAAFAPDYFTAYVRNPESKNPKAKMPGNPKYDDDTLRALIVYFKTFSSSRPGEAP